MSRISNCLFVIAMVSVICASAQVNTAPNKSAEPVVITVYRTGKATVGIQVKVDGVDVAKLSDHKQITFKVSPGYHELSAKLGAYAPIRVFTAEAGQELFFALDFEGPRVAGMFHPQDMTIAPVNTVLDLKTTEIRLNDEELKKILESANPTGLEPSDSAPGQDVDPIRTLTDEQVKSAILQGMRDRYAGSIGISLIDFETALGSRMVADGGVSGYSITVYTAETYIEYQAAKAHELMKLFTEADVTPRMRQDVLFIFARPSTPGRLNAQGMALASSANHIVLTDISKRTVIQPIHEETSGVTVDSALRSKEYGSIGAMFTPQQIKRVQDKNAEFLVAVTGGYRKFFKVKKNSPMWRMLQSNPQ